MCPGGTSTRCVPPKLPAFGTAMTSPPLPRTRLHTVCLGFVGDFAMTISPRLMLSVITDNCSTSTKSPDLLNVGSILGPRHMVTCTP